MHLKHIKSWRKYYSIINMREKYMSLHMTKPAKWHLRPDWSESSLSAWKFGSLAPHWEHNEDWSDLADAQADLSLHWAHSHFVGFVMRPLILAYSIESKRCRRNDKQCRPWSDCRIQEQKQCDVGLHCLTDMSVWKLLYQTYYCFQEGRMVWLVSQILSTRVLSRPVSWPRWNLTLTSTMVRQS